MTIRLAITAGEPAGIGPDVVLQLAQSAADHERVVIASPHLLEQRAKQLGLGIRLQEFDLNAPRRSKAGELSVIPVDLGTEVTAGTLNPANAAYVLKCLDMANDLCLDTTLHAICTAPVNKAVINDAGIAFQGHTEYFAQRSNTELVVMMLACDVLRVALVTTHLPLRRIADTITPKLLRSVIEILHHDLRSKFAIEQPHILVAGLNPHAGESGHLGSEEIEIITPVLEQLRTQGMCLEGPLPADTLFTPPYLAKADAVLAMYHDQGLPVLKHLGFGKAVNITLGLPYIRTSVDHGTALDLAATGKAEWSSIAAAEQMAASLASAALSNKFPEQEHTDHG